MTLHPPAALAGPTLAAALETAYREHRTSDAVVTASGALTYQDLAEQAHAVAAGVRAACPAQPGVASSGPAPVVAVVIERSPEFVATVLGVLAAGAVYLPLDPDAPDAFLRDVFTEARPALVITTADRAARLREHTTAPVRPYQDLAAHEPTAPVADGAVDPSQPAYVIYTSGSTGAPKGVLVPHSALLNSTAARADRFGEAGRVLLLHSPAFDLTTGVLFWTLLTGGTLIIDPAGLTDVARTVDLVHEHGVTQLIYPASLYSVFLDRAASRPPTSLKAVGIGSERWSPAVIERHARLLPDTSLFNEFGPTEACVVSSYGRVYDAETGQRTPMAIGRPVRNTGYLLLDADGRPTTGTGELVITGANLALGYLNRPELTAERFVTVDGERAYRTGDLVQQDASGDFVFLERADRQVQVGGHRVEPGHVESVLMEHPRILTTHVTGRAVASESGSTSLVAYLVPVPDADREPSAAGPDADRTGEASFIADCDRHLRARVPAYLVPSAYVVIHELPRTAAGKIDQARLPEPSAAGAQPADALEESLANAAATILGLTDVPVDRSLLMLGANSLALIRLAAVVAADHAVDLPVSALFATPTITDIAALVRAGAPSDRPRIQSGTAPTETGPDGAAGFPLSGQQEQIWVLTQLTPDALAYNTQFSLRMHGPVDITALQRALSHIVTRHEILRSTFHDGTNGPVQVVHEPWQAKVEVVDLTGLPEQDRAAELDARIGAEVAVGFDVATLPLVRWHLFRLAPDEWRLLQVEHHFAHDGWSAQLFLAELRDAYDAIADGRLPDLPALPVQYRDFAAWHHAWRESGDYAGQVAYWCDELSDCPRDGATFAADRPRPVARSYRGGRLSAHIPAEVMHGLDDLATRHGVSRFAVFLSAFALQVWQHTGEEDIVLGSALVNRRQPGTDLLLGMFVNALPLRVRINPAGALSELLRATMDVVLGAQDHQELPLLDLLARLDLPRDPGRNPLFNLMFAFHDTPRPYLRMGSVQASLVIEHNASAKGDINVVCVPDPRHPDGSGQGGMTILWEYDTDLFDADSAEELLGGFETVLSLLSRAADEPVRELDLLGADETARVLAMSTGSADQVPHGTLHAGFAAAVAAHPDAVAVEQAGSSWTYRQLDLHARDLQRRLADAGLRAGAVVAITCPAGIGLVAAILAVLRSGALYVCIDPAQPSARTAAMYEDAAPGVIVADRASLAGAAPSGAPVGVPVVYADDLPVGTAPDTGAPADADIGPADGAYLVYTSGSTGTPKAVLTSHANACAAVHGRTRYLEAAGRESGLPVKTLVTLPVIFDVAPHMMLWTLWSGGTIVVPDTADDARDPDRIRSLVERCEVTHVNFTASFYRQLVRTLPVGWTPKLRVVAIGGEACSPDDIREHAVRVPGAALDNEYGPTEGTVWCSAQRLHPAPPGAGTRVSVGGPLANYRMVVLDPDGRLLPAGAAGELYIGGPGVALGYHRRPELTAERFPVQAGGPLAGQRLYRTGDRVRLRAGSFDILGRLDDQVKVRGFRVELGEVTACLLKHPDVADAAVLLRGSGDTARLVAYVAAPADSAVRPEHMREWAAQRLPSYMLPTGFVIMDRLPRTSTGKIQASQLPEPPEQTGTGPAAEPETPRQQLLLQVWRDTLQQPRIGLDDDFFASGGDSLQAIRAAARTRALGVDVSVADLLTATTVRALDHLITHRPDSDVVAVTERRPGGTGLPLTAIQAWFFDQRFADPDHFHQARLFELADDGDPETLRAALDWVIRRHDAFRTRFTRDGDTWSAVLDEEPAGDLLSEHTVPDGEQPLEQRLDALLRGLHRQIDIEGGRLADFALVRVPGSSRIRVYLIAHHLIVDVVSWQILTDDIAWAHRALLDGRELPDGAAPGIPDRAAEAPAPDTHWETLAKAQKPVLSGAGTAAQTSAAGDRIRVSSRLSQRVATYLGQETRRLHDISAQAVLLAALHRALAPHGDGSDLYVWLEGHGRTQADDGRLENVVGWLTSLYPALLTDLDADPARLVDAAAAVDRQLAAVPDAGTGFGRGRYLHPDSPLGRQLSSVASPQITFNYLGGHQLPAGDRVLRPVAAPEAATISAANVLPTPLDVTVAPATDGTVVCHLSVDPALLSAEEAEQVADRFAAEVENAARMVPLTTAPVDHPARTLFMIHPVDGRIDWYAPMAGVLGRGWDCYGLPHDHTCESTTMSALARRYLDQIRAAKPSGTYTLAGWCMGAPLIYEIARQAHADGDGDRIDDLIVMDPTPADPPANPDAALVDHAHVELPHQTKPAIAEALAATRELPIPERAAALVDLLGPAGPGVPDHPLLGKLRMRLSFHAAMNAWRPTGQVPRLTMCLPEVVTAGHEKAPEGWRPLGATVTVTTIAGDHVSMLSAGELTQAVNSRRDGEGS
ncbi:non-ribosomal peptide synthetase [Streptomyces sp. NRRL S-244]|uniref:non-ribosomal peptide synthetase n=1 Tax=Streptomyces sp. NRRL S-244 TaxID=1463897 RepID=UPI0004BF234A|nr:non-ribosomal peptide synthetase [Streptomyces sp. NRRL S-244]